MSCQPTNQPTDQPTDRLTLEVFSWLLIAAVALALRLLHLDAAPLAAGEAREAMLAWRAVNGQGMPVAGYAPLLFIANAALFALCGASDAIARLWPAVLGSVLVLAPLLFRQRIGRLAALVAGLYLAISPSALFAARQLDGAAVVAAGVLVCLGGLIRLFDTGTRSWLALAAGALALAVAAGSSVYGLVLTCVLAWLSLAWVWPGVKIGGLGVGERLRPQWLYALAVFSLLGLALCTGLGWNLAGLGAAGDLLVGWFERFRPAPGNFVSPVILLGVYEPMALLFGLGGFVWAARREWRFGVFLGLWAVLQTLLLILMPGRLPLDTLGVVLPLALLTGYAVQALAQSLQAHKAWLGEWLYALVVVVLWGHLYLRLAHYALYGQVADLVLALLTLILQVFLAAVFALAVQTGVVLRGIVVGTGVVLLAATISAGWGLAYVRPSDPRELLTHEPTADTVRDLVQTLRDLSWRETRMPEMLPFTLVTPPDSVLAWYLRDFSAVRQVEQPGDLGAGEAGQVLVTSWRDWLPPSSGYVGHEFILQRSWDPREAKCIWGQSLWEQPPQCSQAFRWLLFRRVPGVPPAGELSAVLWVWSP
jgi:uncharacterized protein (TIGR03663 family)